MKNLILWLALLVSISARGAIRENFATTNTPSNLTNIIQSFITGGSATNAIGNSSGFGTNTTLRALTAADSITATNFSLTVAPTSTNATQSFKITTSGNSNTTPFQIIDPRGSNVFELLPRANTNYWMFTVGDKDNKNISDTLIYQSSVGFFQVNFGTSGFFELDSGGNGNVNDGQGTTFPIFNTHGIHLATQIHGQFFTNGPAVAVGAAAGSGGTVGVTFSDFNPTDLAVEVHLRTGNTGTASGTLFTVTFERLYDGAPHVIFSPQDTASVAAAPVVYVDRATTTSAHFLLKTTAALVVNTDYYWQFFIVE